MLLAQIPTHAQLCYQEASLFHQLLLRRITMEWICVIHMSEDYSLTIGASTLHVKPLQSGHRLCDQWVRDL